MLSNTAAQPYDLRNRDPAVFESTRHAIDLAHRAGDATLESAALDELTAVHLAVDDIPGAVRVVRRREQVIGTLAVGREQRLRDSRLPPHGGRRLPRRR